MNDQLIGLTNSDRLVFRHVCIPNFIMQGQRAYRFLSPETENHNKSNLHVFQLYINVIIWYSFKIELAITKKVSVVVTAILEITQDSLCVVVARVQPLHFNMFFFIKYIQIQVAKTLTNQDNIVF